MSGNKATEGTIIIERGDVVDVQNLNVNGTTYKYDNTRTLVEGTSGEEQPQQTGFTGTIYRNSTENAHNGGSIVPTPKNKYCVVNEDPYNSCTDENWGYEDESECLENVEQYWGEGTECVQGTITIPGLTSYETEETKSNITKDVYLKHDVENNIITASYVCGRYIDSVTNESVEVCLQGGDPSYHGDETTGNVKILKDIQTSFERSLTNASCNFYSSYSSCGSSELHLETHPSDGTSAYVSGSICRVSIHSDGVSVCS